MREEHPSTDQWVGLMSSYFLEPLQQRVVDPFRTELDDKLIVVDCGLLAILGYGALHIPRCDDLLVDRSLRETRVGFCSVDDLCKSRINPRNELQDEASLRGEIRRRECRSYGIDSGSWYLRHDFGRVRSERVCIGQATWRQPRLRRRPFVHSRTPENLRSKRIILRS